MRQSILRQRLLLHLMPQNPILQLLPLLLFQVQLMALNQKGLLHIVIFNIQNSHFLFLISVKFLQSLLLRILSFIPRINRWLLPTSITQRPIMVSLLISWKHIQIAVIEAWNIGEARRRWKSLHFLALVVHLDLRSHLIVVCAEHALSVAESWVLGVWSVAICTLTHLFIVAIEEILGVIVGSVDGWGQHTVSTGFLFEDVFVIAILLFVHFLQKVLEVT